MRRDGCATKIGQTQMRVILMLIVLGLLVSGCATPSGRATTDALEAISRPKVYSELSEAQKSAFFRAPLWDDIVGDVRTPVTLTNAIMKTKDPALQEFFLLILVRIGTADSDAAFAVTCLRLLADPRFPDDHRWPVLRLSANDGGGGIAMADLWAHVNPDWFQDSKRRDAVARLKLRMVRYFVCLVQEQAKCLALLLSEILRDSDLGRQKALTEIASILSCKTVTDTTLAGERDSTCLRNIRLHGGNLHLYSAEKSKTGFVVVGLDSPGTLEVETLSGGSRNDRIGMPMFRLSPRQMSRVNDIFQEHFPPSSPLTNSPPPKVSPPSTP
jgi:hypothetical protein